MGQKRNYNQYYREPVVEEEKSEDLEPVTEAEVEVEKEEEEVKSEPVSAPVVKEQKVEELKKGRVIGAANLNVRDKASTSGKIVDQLRPGQGVLVKKEENEEWYKIQSPDGFVMKKFIELV